MSLSITVCGQSNASGHWRTQEDAAAFPPEPFNRSGANFSSDVNANSEANGHAIWGYVAHLLALRHSGIGPIKCWNAAVGSTGVALEWNGTKMVATDIDGGNLVTSGTTLTASACDLSVFADGDTLFLRNMGTQGTRTVTGTPLTGSLSVTSAFTTDGTYTEAAVRSNAIDYDDPAFDPNSYYAAAKALFDRGTFDKRIVICQWGNRDYKCKQNSGDMKVQLQKFVDYWQNEGADAILLGGTLLGENTASGDFFDNGMIFMRDVWLSVCTELASENADVHLGAHVGQEFDWSVTLADAYKSDEVHFSYSTNFVAAEAWYRAIATALGYTPSTVGAVDLTFPRIKTA